MQKLKKIVLFISVILMLFTANVFPTYAKELSQDGLKAELILEKTDYEKNEEIPIAIIVTNTNDYDIEDVTIEGIIPDGFTLKSKSAVKTVDVLKSGQGVELSYILMLAETELQTTETPKPTNSDTPTISYKLGDINNDGKITSSDARYALRFAARLETPTKNQKKIGDVDKDDKITSSDARKLLRVSAKLDTLDNNFSLLSIIPHAKTTVSSGKISVIPLAVNGGIKITAKDINITSANKNTACFIFLLTLVFGAAAFIVFFAKRYKLFTKRTVCIVLGGLIALTSVSGLALFKAVADNSEDTEKRKSFTISEQITVHEKKYIITNKVLYSRNNIPIVSSDVEKVKEGFTDYFSIKKDIDSINKKYKTEDGHILPKDAASVINLVAEYAEKKLQQGLIKEYGAEIENNCVWITLRSGIEFLYMPNIDGIDSTDISSYQPCLFTYPAEIQEKSKKATDGSAKMIQDWIDDYNFANNYDNADITLDTLKKIGANEVIIWHGHGGYNTKHHSHLMTSIKLNEEQFLLDPIYYISKIGYTADYLSGRIICTNSGYVCVTYKFFEHYLSNLNNSFIYLGACSSGKDSTLANTFKSKGASTVVTNTDTIHTLYNISMIEDICTTMTNVSHKTKKYYTAGEALDIAQKENSATCCSEHPNTKVKIWGETNYRYRDHEQVNIGSITGYIKEQGTEKPLADITATAINGEKAIKAQTDKSGKFTMMVPVGNWEIFLENTDMHFCYERQSVTVEKDIETVLLNPIYMTPTSYLMGTVVDKSTNAPIENASVLLRLQNGETDTYSKEYSCSTNKDGQFTINIPVGTYTYEINKLNLFEELYEPATGTTTISKADGNILGTVYLIPKGETQVIGYIREKGKSSPIANATVEVFDISNVSIIQSSDGTYNYEDFKKGKLIATATTDENGKYSLNLPSGKYALAVNCENYEFSGTIFSLTPGLKEYSSDTFLTAKNINTGTDELFIKHLLNCKHDLIDASKFSFSQNIKKGIFSTIINDFDHDGLDEMLTFSLAENGASQEEIIIDLYCIENGKVIKKQSSKPIFASKAGNGDSSLCATLDEGVIRVYRETYSYGGSSVGFEYLTYIIKDNSLILYNDFLRGDFYRYDSHKYQETVSGKEYSSSTELYADIKESGFSIDAHVHGIYSISESESKNIEELKGNHIFTFVNGQDFSRPGRYGFIFDNSQLKEILPLITTEILGSVKDKEKISLIPNATVEVFDISNVSIKQGANCTYNYEDFKKGKLSATVTTDENGKYSLNLPSGEYALAVNCENYEFNGTIFSLEFGHSVYQVQDILLESKNLSAKTCLTSIKCNEFSRYTGNVGDSNFTALDGSYTLHPTGTYYGYTNTGVDGKQYNNGFCVWIARWNYGDRISWAQAKFDLAGKYKTLSGKSTLMKAYNTNNLDNFDTSVFLYNGDKLLHSFTMTSESHNFDFSIDVTDVEELTVLVKDNKETAAGTPFALYDMFLE